MHSNATIHCQYTKCMMQYGLNLDRMNSCNGKVLQQARGNASTPELQNTNQTLAGSLHSPVICGGVQQLSGGRRKMN